MARGYISPREIASELLDRYQKSGPRYTSYPTAPQFHPDFDREAALARWQQSNGDGAPGLSFYLHLPFCRQRCTYCGCYTLLGVEEEAKREYTRALLDQLDWSLETVDAVRPVEQLSLGGGTPTSLLPEDMRRLIEGMQQRLTFAPEGERAIEVDPRWVDTDYLDLLLELGFNRFSFGVQDLEPAVQKRINRELPASRLAELMEHLRKRGCPAINLDFIYGLPGQTAESFLRTIRQVLTLSPTRVALFGYAHVPWVAPHQKDLEDYGLPGPDLRMELFGLAFEAFLDAGWRHVGMDHFAQAEDELVRALDSRTLTRNFMGYSTRKGLDLVGLGASAIAGVHGTYVQTTKAVPSFVAGRGLERWARGYVLSDEDMLRRDVILDLLCNFHLDRARVERTYGIGFGDHFERELANLGTFVADGLVEVDDEHIGVTPLGRFFIRNIAMTFDTYLGQEGNRTQRYSRTI